MNLRCDQYFVEDEKWHEAADHYGEYLEEISNHGKSGTLFHRDNNSKRHVVLLELGVGFNTPTIIRFPFERLMREKKNMKLIRLNKDEAIIPESFGKRGIGINADLSSSLKDIKDCIMR